MEVGFGELEGVVEPAAEVVVAGAGVGLAEEFSDLGGDLGVVEERMGRILGAEEGIRKRREDCRERFDG